MRPESRKYLYDIQDACEAIGQFIDGKGFDDYIGNLLLRSAVERQLMIASEAVSQLVRTDAETAQGIEDAREIINLRNVIVHGYTIVENETIWGILQANIPKLHDHVRRFLGES